MAIELKQFLQNDFISNIFSFKNNLQCTAEAKVKKVMLQMNRVNFTSFRHVIKSRKTFPQFREKQGFSY